MNVNECVVLVLWSSLCMACHNIALNFQMSCCLPWQKIDSERREETIKDKKCLDKKTICSEMLHISIMSFPFFQAQCETTGGTRCGGVLSSGLAPSARGNGQDMINGAGSSSGNNGDPDTSCCIFSCLKFCRLLMVWVEVYNAIFLLPNFAPSFKFHLTSSGCFWWWSFLFGA